MRWLLYLRLVTLTAGTLLPFFWMVVILGHRRQRNFERVFFFLCLALTCFFGSSLLALNAQLFYTTPPAGLLRFAWTFICLGVWFVPPLVVQLHAEYAFLRGLLLYPRQKYLWLAIAWIPSVAVSLELGRALRLARGFDFERPTHLLGILFQLWIAVAVALAAYWQRRFSRIAPDDPQKSFHKRSSVYLSALAALLLVLFFLQRVWRPETGATLSTLLLLLGLVPLGLLIGSVQRFNFLQIGRQRNLIYAVFAVFLALLYLSFVRRAGLWLEPYLPPEATAALLLFLPVVFFEPLQRAIRQLLRQTAQTEVDRAQKLMRPINEVARLGDQAKLVEFSERWIGEQLQLASVKLEMSSTDASSSPTLVAKSSPEEVFVIARAGRYLGRLRVRPHGAMVSGETFAALEFVAEQLPAAFDLCHLIEEKLQLERELAERERMALVGQMAASISHNLKNPLGSIKTILQVQMENAELPASLRGETQMVLDEINRLSAKLNQLLQFSRPGVRAAKKGDRCNIVAVAADVVEVLRREAEASGVSIESSKKSSACEVAASAEAINDILSNVVLNAIEAIGRGGRISLGFHCELQTCTVSIEDDGPGIPPALKEKILQPFFTTKARGTGLGLAIVMRRLEEIGGKMEIDSPIRGERGSRFRVILPLGPKEATP
ncbi:MAG TPA: ATP-binding protein [Candidatus Limnocylindrales bacterium]|nr:ATP-binding protein [Candidatus Limnocylindrales bacterium]